jgi:hypothetical protein
MVVSSGISSIKNFTTYPKSSGGFNVKETVIRYCIRIDVDFALPVPFGLSYGLVLVAFLGYDFRELRVVP